MSSPMALGKRNARRFPSPLPHFPAKSTPQRIEVLLPHPLPSKSKGKAEKYSGDRMPRCPAWKGAFLTTWKSVGGSSLISWSLGSSEGCGAPEESYAHTRNKSLSPRMASREGGGTEPIELLAFPPDHTSEECPGDCGAR